MTLPFDLGLLQFIFRLRQILFVKYLLFSTGQFSGRSDNHWGKLVNLLL